jgi:hypothetical protein
MKQIPLKNIPIGGMGPCWVSSKEAGRISIPGIGKGGAVDAFVGTRYDQFMVFNDTNSS